MSFATPIRILTLFMALCVMPLQSSAKTLRVSLSDDATTLDPHVANRAINNRLLANVYEGLVRRDAEFNIAPVLRRQGHASPLAILNSNSVGAPIGIRTAKRIFLGASKLNQSIHE